MEGEWCASGAESWEWEERREEKSVGGGRWNELEGTFSPRRRASFSA